MDNVRFLKSAKFTPRELLKEVERDLPRMKSVFIVAIEYTGEPQLYVSGNLGDCSFASLALQNLALDYLNHNIKKTEKEDAATKRQEQESN